jgi:hypothetical protein
MSWPARRLHFFLPLTDTSARRYHTTAQNALDLSLDTWQFFSSCLMPVVVEGKSLTKLQNVGRVEREARNMGRCPVIGSMYHQLRVVNGATLSNRLINTNKAAAASFCAERDENTRGCCG